jgi:membrane fusion protein, copper/silver efflux system
MKAVKLSGLVLIGLALAAFGYWRGMNDQKASPPKAATSEPTAGMEGMEMAPGAAIVSPDKQQLLGVRTTTVEARPLSKTVRTVGTIKYDETKVTRIHSKIEGWVEKLYANYTGKFVQKGQPLFTMYSPDLLATQGEYLLALKSHERLSGSSIPEVRAGAAALVEASKQRLMLWDISDQQIRDLEQKREPQRTLTFYAPNSGFVIKKDINEGMKIMLDKELYTIADLSTVWVDADVYESEISLIKVGQQATINLSYYPEETFRGKISFIYPYLDEKTRTVKVRLEFPNPALKLKPDMYVNAEIKIDSGKHLAVPEEAVLDTGLRKVIFIDKGNGRFEPKEIKLGSKLDGFYQVLSGVKEGEKIAASSVFLLDSESRLSEAMGAMAGMSGMDTGETQKKASAAATATEKKSGDLMLALETQPVKPKVGDSVVRLKIRDAKGNPVEDAAVNVTFAMNMPGMAAGKTAAKHLKDGVYEAKVSLAMAGAWEIGVSVQRPGQKPVQEKFTVTAQ